MKALCVIAMATLVVAGYAETEAPKPPVAPKSRAVAKKSKAEIREAVYRATGGMMIDTRSQKGKIVYVNCQNEVPETWLAEHAKLFADEMKVNFSVGKGTFDFKKPALQGDASIFIVADKEMPMSLIATEAKWAMVNVLPLKSDQESFYKARVQKEIARCIALLCGAAGSQFPNAVVEPVTKASDLDPFICARLPYDLLQRMSKFMPGIGITPYKTSTYRRACREGWAPSPTNDVQKKIWNDIRALPTKPIVIQPEKAK